MSHLSILSFLCNWIQIIGFMYPMLVVLSGMFKRQKLIVDSGTLSDIFDITDNFVEMAEV